MHKLGVYVERRIAAPIESVLVATAQYDWERDLNGFRAAVTVGTFAAEIEVLPWSEGMCHLGVRPSSTRPHQWTARRRQRWFDAAHDLIDEIRDAVIEVESALPDYDISAWERSA